MYTAQIFLVGGETDYTVDFLISAITHEVVEAMYECTNILFLSIQFQLKSSTTIDFTHTFIPLHLQVPFRDRRGVISQNVLAAVNFDMTFSYALVGWEDSVHDSTVLDDAKLRGYALSRCWIRSFKECIDSILWIQIPFKGIWRWQSSSS